MAEGGEKLLNTGMNSAGGLHITSEEVNYLVYRYLLESGFNHSAFTFAAESDATTTATGASLPHGSLIKFLQKGLQYWAIESHLNEVIGKLVCKKKNNGIWIGEGKMNSST